MALTLDSHRQQRITGWIQSGMHGRKTLGMPQRNKILAIDDENRCEIVCIETIEDEGAVTLMYQDFEKHNSKIKTGADMRPHKRLVPYDTTDGWCIMDPATAMLVLDFGTNLRTGVKPLPEEPQHLLTEGNGGQHEHRRSPSENATCTRKYHNQQVQNKTRQRITRGTSLKAYEIERKKARSLKREQETTIRTWEEES